MGLFEQLGKDLNPKIITEDLKEITENQVIKDELIKHMTVLPGKYIIDITPDEWHRIFKMKN